MLSSSFLLVILILTIIPATATDAVPEKKKELINDREHR